MTRSLALDAAGEARLEQLVASLTLDEKAGQLFHAMAFVDASVIPDEDGLPLLPGPVHDYVVKNHVTHMNLVNVLPPDAQARWYNALQVLARQTGSGIPVTVSSDPRSAATERAGASHSAGAFSAWPEPTGLAATRDPELARRFGDAVRQEFRAVGIRTLLGPQVDIATEPRWSRISGTWGGDPTLTGELASAFIEAVQTAELGPDSVATMVKHFPGGGPQKDGEDPHFAHGKEQVYPGGHLAEHAAPFPPTLAAGANQVMAYYGMPVGTELEEVAFAFNRQVITGMLREGLQFEGIISTDWGVLNDREIFGQLFEARAWGIEQLDPPARTLRALEAGVDQFGGDSESSLVAQLVRDGRISEARIDESVRRILREKLRLGLFDAAPLDPAHALDVVGRADLVAAGLEAQRRSLTLITNGDPAHPTLPLAAKLRVFAPDIDDAVLFAYADVAGSVDEADVVILRLATPHDHRETTIFESSFHSGPLDFGADELARIRETLAARPTVVVQNLERPAVIPEIAAEAAALVGDFGSSDRAVLDVLFGRAEPEGRLPFQLPRSMADVLAGDLDQPHRFADPLFDFGHGLTYVSSRRNTEGTPS